MKRSSSNNKSMTSGYRKTLAEFFSKDPAKRQCQSTEITTSSILIDENKQTEAPDQSNPEADTVSQFDPSIFQGAQTYDDDDPTDQRLHYVRAVTDVSQPLSTIRNLTASSSNESIQSIEINEMFSQPNQPENVTLTTEIARQTFEGSSRQVRTRKFQSSWLKQFTWLEWKKPNKLLFVILAVL